MKLTPWIHERFERLTAPRQVLGIHLTLTATGAQVRLLWLQQRKGEVYPVGEPTYNTEGEPWWEQLPAGTAVSLTVDGKGVLFKRLEDPSQSLLPGVSEQELVVTPHPPAWKAGVRKEVLQPWLDRLSAQGAYVRHVQVGPFGLSLLSGLVEPAGSLVAGPYTLQFSQGALVSVEKAPEGKGKSYRIGDHRIAHSDLLAYAAAVQGFLPTEPTLELEESQREYRARRLFRVGYPAVLALLLVILGGNALVYYPAFQEHPRLRAQLARHQALLQSVDSLQRWVDHARQQRDQWGVGAPSHHAYMADQLALTLPRTARFTRLCIQPLASHQGQPQVVRQRIEVTGTGSELTDLHHWLDQLARLSWIHRVSTPQYQWDPARKRGEFHLTLDYR